MNITFGDIEHDFGRDLYYTKIDISSEDNTEGTTILAAASNEYIEDNFKTNNLKDTWGVAVANKWQSIGNELFRRKLHFDVYTNTGDEAAESNGLDYLVRLARK